MTAPSYYLSRCWPRSMSAYGVTGPQWVKSISTNPSWQARTTKWEPCVWLLHYNDVMMSAIASQIIGAPIVYSTARSGADQRKQQCSASLAFVRGIHRWPVKSPHKGPVTRQCFHLMTSSWVGAVVRTNIRNYVYCRRTSDFNKSLRVRIIPNPQISKIPMVHNSIFTFQMAYLAVRTLRGGYDLVSGYNRNVRDEKLWIK